MQDALTSSLGTWMIVHPTRYTAPSPGDPPGQSQRQLGCCERAFPPAQRRASAPPQQGVVACCSLGQVTVNCGGGTAALTLTRPLPHRPLYSASPPTALRFATLPCPSGAPCDPNALVCAPPTCVPSTQLASSSTVCCIRAARAPPTCSASRASARLLGTSAPGAGDKVA